MISINIQNPSIRNIFDYLSCTCPIRRPSKGLLQLLACVGALCVSVHILLNVQTWTLLPTVEADGDVFVRYSQVSGIQTRITEILPIANVFGVEFIYIHSSCFWTSRSRLQKKYYEQTKYFAIIWVHCANVVDFGLR